MSTISQIRLIPLCIGPLFLSLFSTSASCAVVDERERTSLCGPLALQVCLNSTGSRIQHRALLDRLPALPAETDYNLLQLEACAKELGCRTRALRWKRVPEIPAPAIIPLTVGSKKHFVAMLATRNDAAWIVDIPHTGKWVKLSVLREEYDWNGDALHIAASEADLTSVASTDARMAWGLRSAVLILVAICALTAVYKTIIPSRT